MKASKTILLLLFCTFCVGGVAQSLDLCEEENRIFLNHQQEMAEPVNFLMADAYQELKSEHFIDPELVRTLQRFCYVKELRKYICNYMEMSPEERLSRKHEIEEVYMDSVYMLLIPLNPRITGKVTGNAIMIADEIGITPQKQDTLMTYAIDYIHRLRRNPCANFAREEMDRLKRLLNEKQLVRAINVKNEIVAHDRAENLWKAIVKAGLDEGQDSTQQVRKAFRYYSLEMYVNDYFVEQPELIKANLNELYSHKPDIIKMYEGIRTKEAVIRKHEKKVGMEYAW